MISDRIQSIQKMVDHIRKRNSGSKTSQPVGLSRPVSGKCPYKTAEVAVVCIGRVVEVNEIIKKEAHLQGTRIERKSQSKAEQKTDCEKAQLTPTQLSTVAASGLEKETQDTGEPSDCASIIESLLSDKVIFFVKSALIESWRIILDS